MVVLEIFYLISAVLCAILYPLVLAYQAKESTWENRSSKSGAKNFLTYGHIVRGFLVGIVPVVNTIVAIGAIGYHVNTQLKLLDKIKVVKPKVKR
jgi:hypothetical protein